MKDFSFSSWHLVGVEKRRNWKLFCLVEKKNEKIKNVVYINLLLYSYLIKKKNKIIWMMQLLMELFGLTHSSRSPLLCSVFLSNLEGIFWRAQRENIRIPPILPPKITITKYLKKKKKIIFSPYFSSQKSTQQNPKIKKSQFKQTVHLPVLGTGVSSSSHFKNFINNQKLDLLLVLSLNSIWHVF